MNKMIILVVTVCSLIVGSLGDPNEDFAKALDATKQQCMKENNVDAKKVENSFKGEFADDKDLKCFMKCLLNKMGYAKEDGSLNVDFMKAHPRPSDTPEQNQAAIEACKSVEGADACEKSFNLAKCLHGALPHKK